MNSSLIKDSKNINSSLIIFSVTWDLITSVRSCRIREWCNLSGKSSLNTHASLSDKKPHAQITRSFKPALASYCSEMTRNTRSKVLYCVSIAYGIIYKSYY